VIKGDAAKPFKYLDKGMMAMIAHGAAVAQLPTGPSLTGHLGWASWLGVHLMLLSGGEQKSSTLVDWGINLLTHNRTKRIITSEDEKAVAQEAPVAD
jgi:NADH dehydrogenase